jgi:hypothetical protein
MHHGRRNFHHLKIVAGDYGNQAGFTGEKAYLVKEFTVAKREDFLFPILKNRG